MLNLPLLVILYGGSALVSILLSQSVGILAAIWLPNALFIGLRLRSRSLGIFPDLVAFVGGIALANLAVGMGWGAAFGLAGANLAEVGVAVFLLGRLAGAGDKADLLQRSALTLAIAGVVAPMVGAPLGALVLHLAVAAPFMQVWWTWFAGALLGAMSILPITLTISREALADVRRAPTLLRIAAYMLGTVALSALAIHFMRFPFVAVALPVLFAAATLPPFQTALVSLAAVATVVALSSLFQGAAEGLFLSLSLNVAVALAVIPPFLFSLLRARLGESEARLAASERLFRTAMTNSAIGMAIVDETGRLTESNPRFSAFLGYGADELRQVDFRDITHPDDLAADEAMVGDLLAGRRDQYEMEKRYIRKDGTEVWGLLAVSILRSTRAQEPSFFVSQIADIDRRKRSEEALQQVNRQLYDEKERLRITLYSIGDAVITTDRWARITFMNPVAERLTGWKREEVEGRPLSDIFKLVLEATQERIPNPVDECLLRGQPYYLQDGAALLARDGSMVSIQDSAAPVRGPDGVVFGAVLIFQDVSHTRSLQRELIHSAMHDSLTDLPNRRAFERSLTSACSDAGTRVVRHVVGYLDLDRFKLINDTAGHAAGDAALRDLARLIKSMLRKEDVVARLGGDEFGIILHDCSVDQAQAIGEKLILSIRSAGFRWSGRTYELGASFGITEISGGRRDPTELLMEADIACYAAKSSGRNRVVAYHGKAREAVRYRQDMDMAASLKDAIEQGRFRLFAQEIVKFAPDQDAARFFEVFVRMIGTGGDLVLPGDFIPAAERYNLMGAVDRWVITTVCESFGPVLASEPNIHLSINISTDTLNDEALWPFVEEKIRASGIAPQQLCFEVTETALMTNVGVAIEFVSQAQALGCRIALDDFGVGMSSFFYLKLFKVDEIKIDASFVRDVETVERDRQIIRAIVELGRSLDIDIVVEGIESAEQLRHVQALGVTMGQGFHWGRPAPMESVLGVELAPPRTVAAPGQA